MRALGAYIFAGGFTLGVRQHFDVLAHFEEGPYGVKTARLNFPELPIFVGPENWPLDDAKYYGVDFLYGNSPCAPWSQASGRPMDNWRTDPRVECTRRHFGLLEQLAPRVWAWESVAATWNKGREFVDELAAAAMRRGYAVTVFLHDAKYLGVPHNRARMMVVAHKVKLTFEAPDWSVIPCGEALRKLNDRGDLHAEAQGYANRIQWLIPHAKQGEDLRTTFNRVMAERGFTEDTLPRNALGQVKDRPGYLLKRSRADQPANTVMHDQVHPTEDRLLTLKELAHLCGYPADFELAPPASIVHEYTRAVMPPVAEYVARMVRQSLEANEPIGKPSYFVVDYRKPPGSVREEILVDGLSRPAADDSPHQRKSLGSADQVPAGSVVSAAGVAVSGAPGQEPAVVARPGATAGVPRPKAGVGRMAFLQVLIMMGRWTGPQMVEIVKHHWPQSKASGADVSTQRRVLVQKGYTPPPTLRKPVEDLPW